MRRRTLVVGSLAAGLLIALLGGGAPAGGADSPFRVDKLILTTSTVSRNRSCDTSAGIGRSRPPAGRSPPSSAAPPTMSV